jgi:putative ABC transport system ATP-binding protein
LIEIDRLRFAWPRASHDCLAIDSLAIATGRTLFLHGPSGGGKSTLLGLLAGVLVPREGRVSVLGTEWSRLPGARRDAWRADHVGYIFQQFNLLSYLSVIDNVLLPCRFSTLRRERAARRSGTMLLDARSLLSRVGLPPGMWQRPAADLSIGQQQRVAAARALIGVPEIVIADEPTSALDAPLRDSFMDVLLHECGSAGSTLVFVSHDRRLADRFDEVVALEDINRTPPPGAAA